MRQGHAAGGDGVKRCGQLKLTGFIFKPNMRSVRDTQPCCVVRVQGDAGLTGAVLNVCVVGVRVVEPPARGRAQQAETTIRWLGVRPGLGYAWQALLFGLVRGDFNLAAGGIKPQVFVENEWGRADRTPACLLEGAEVTAGLHFSEHLADNSLVRLK